MKRRAKLHQLISPAAILLGTGIIWLVVAVYRSHIGMPGRWGDSILAGFGIGFGFALLYYAATYRSEEVNLKRTRIVSILIGILSSLFLTIAMAVISGALTFYL